MKSINPFTNKAIQAYRKLSRKEATDNVDMSFNAFLDWRNTDLSARSASLKTVASVLRSQKEQYATLITSEMGKVFKESLAEVEKCALVCDYYADMGPIFLKDEPIQSEALSSFVTYQPIGLVLGIMPWNFPMWQVFRFAAPTVMAGNGVLLKHASNVSGVALAIEALFRTGGFPEHLFKTLLIDAKGALKLIEHPAVGAVTFTGSTEAGRSIATKAAENLKKSVLELGGSDPYLILEDADITKAAQICAQSRLINAGQSCISGKRFIILDAVYNDFLEQFIHEMGRYEMGDPMALESDLGPMATKTLREKLHEQVEASIAKGAVPLLGCQIPEKKGAFYPPSILTDVHPGSPAFDEELFGPVAAVTRVKDEASAIALANKSRYGLGAAVFTRDFHRGMQLAKNRLQSGVAFVNDFVKSDPRLPFGGIKESGYGRELSYFGIREFVNIKTVSGNGA